MAYYTRNHEDFDASRVVSIIATEAIENYTVYVVQVTLGPYFWTVKHRYSEFYEMHEQLVEKRLVDKSLLPPKKLFGNQDMAFIRKRQQELELYLQAIMQYLHFIPSVLSTFLGFPNYEIHGITQFLAEELFNKGDMYLNSSDIIEMTPLYLHAITQRLKVPEPTCDSGDLKKDLGHILDFCAQAKYLKLQGSMEQVGTSNFSMNNLPFEMSAFKSLETLHIDKCNPTMMSAFDNFKSSLLFLKIQKSLQILKDFLVQDVMYWESDTLEDENVVRSWKRLKQCDFSHNCINEIDESMQVLPQVERLDLSHNKIDSIQNLHYLTQLHCLKLNFNEIKSLDALHTKIGNVKELFLSGNRISGLQGFSRLYSLELLDVSHNHIDEIQEIEHVALLPCLENLTLFENPLTHIVDYRTKTLEYFGERVHEITLDSLKPDQKEVDTVKILQALSKAKRQKQTQKQLHSESTNSLPGRPDS